MKKTAAEVNKASFIDYVPPEVESGRQLVQEYAKFSPDEVDAHLFDIVRDVRCPLSVNPDSKAFFFLTRDSGHGMCSLTALLAGSGFLT